MFEIAEKTPRQHFEGTVQPAQAKLKLGLQEWVVFILMTHLKPQWVTHKLSITFLIEANAKLQ
jgi:hypothetical protein